VSAGISAQKTRFGKRLISGSLVPDVGNGGSYFRCCVVSVLTNFVSTNTLLVMNDAATAWYEIPSRPAPTEMVGSDGTCLVCHEADCICYEDCEVNEWEVPPPPESCVRRSQLGIVEWLDATADEDVDETPAPQLHLPLAEVW